MPRVHALGKVDELLEKAHWWMTGEIDRDEERREKNFQTNRKRRGRNFTAASFVLYCCLFYSGTEGTVEWRKWRFPVLLLFLSPTTTKVNGVVFGFFSSFLSGVGISNHFVIMPVPPFLSHNPFMGSFPFSLLLLSCMVEVYQVTCQQQGSQFHLRLLSLYRAWCWRISTLEICAK